MTFFASLALVFVLVVRPQEIWPWMEALHLLDVLTALVVFGLGTELALKKQRDLYTPQVPFLLAFVAACFLVTGLNLGMGQALPRTLMNAVFPVIFAAAVTYGVRNVGQLKGMLTLLVGLGLFMAAVGIHQGNQTSYCMGKDKDEDGELKTNPELVDGRECGMVIDCKTEDTTVDDWGCEYIGLFQTFSTGKRVRWRGQLADPNELSVYLGAIISFLIALLFPVSGPSAAPPLSSRKGRLVWALLALGIILWAIILTQSRGGQLVVAAVLMAYFVTRVG